VLVITVLFVVDTTLVKTVRGESKIEAADFFAQGKALIARGDYKEPIGRLEEALMIERDNHEYPRYWHKRKWQPANSKMRNRI
jgi:hypothetical protein